MMCAGVTIWTAILEAGLKKGQTLGIVGIVGISGLGILGIQFAKALGYRVVAIHYRNISSKLETVPEALRHDLFVSIESPDAVEQIGKFNNGIGLDGAVVCNDFVPVNDWILHRLHPRGTCVVLGLPEQGFQFDASNIVIREIVVTGSLHASVEDMENMLLLASAHNVQSQVSIVPFEEAEGLPLRFHAHEFSEKPVVTMK